MDKQNQGTKATNEKPINQGETKMNREVKRIQKMVKSGWSINPIDAEVLPIVGSMKLADLLKDPEAIKAMQKMKNVVRLTNVVETKDEETGEVERKKIFKDIHLWSNDEWANVLTSVGPMLQLQYPNTKKCSFVPLSEFNPEEHGDFIVTHKNSSLPVDHEGFIVPVIGGLNVKTGSITSTHEPVIVQKSELFHKWHDVPRKDISTNKKSKRSRNTETDPIAVCHRAIAEAKNAKDKDAQKTWELRLNVLSNLKKNNGAKTSK